MPAVDVETYLVADSDFTASLDGSLPISLAIQGDSSVGMNLGGLVALTWSVQGDSTIYAAPLDFDIAACAMTAGSDFTSVMILRKALVPGQISAAPPNPFPGLQVGRLPPVRSSSPTINTNPRRTRRPPEEPER